MLVGGAACATGPVVAKPISVAVKRASICWQLAQHEFSDANRDLVAVYTLVTVFMSYQIPPAGHATCAVSHVDENRDDFCEFSDPSNRSQKPPDAPAPNMARKPDIFESAYAQSARTTSKGRIISLSSCSRIWQCQTYLPSNPSNFVMIRVTESGSTRMVSFQPRSPDAGF